MRQVVLSLLGMLLLLVSCNHKELCYSHPHTAKVRVNVDWTEFVEEDPTGMTVMVYPADGGMPYTALTHTLDHASFNLPEGLYHSLVFNQSVSEFGSLEFRQMDTYDKAEVVSATQDSRWYEGRADGGRVVTQSEWIATHREEGGRVTREMVEEVRSEGKYRSGEGSEYILSNLVPQNIIYTVHVRVNIKGVYNLRSARAALDGMAEGYRFAMARSSNVTATYLMEEWNLTVNQADPTQGYIDGTLYCFGLPDGHSAQSEDNQLLLSLLLVDNKTILDFPFMVGDKFIRDEDPNKLHLYLELELTDPLPDVNPEGGSGSGFDATVEDWGEEIEHDIQM